MSRDDGDVKNTALPKARASRPGARRLWAHIPAIRGALLQRRAKIGAAARRCRSVFLRSLKNKGHGPPCEVASLTRKSMPCATPKLQAPEERCSLMGATPPQYRPLPIRYDPRQRAQKNCGCHQRRHPMRLDEPLDPSLIARSSKLFSYFTTTFSCQRCKWNLKNSTTTYGYESCPKALPEEIDKNRHIAFFRLTLTKITIFL